MQITHSQQFLRKRKFMLVLPLLTLPFLTLAFWAMGGGQTDAQADNLEHAGLNLQLPDPTLADESRDSKLSFYDRAQEDSLKLRQQMLNDPYYKGEQDTAGLATSFPGVSIQSPYSGQLNSSPYYSPGATDANEARIYERLDALNKVITQPPTANPGAKEKFADPLQSGNESNFSTEVDRLQGMMQMMSDNHTGDPEMQQMAGVLDKILDIQHPERVIDKVKEKSLQHKETVFAVHKRPTENRIGLLDTIITPQKAIGFYTASNESSVGYDANTIEAELPRNQILVNGSVITLRLTNAVYINGAFIPKNTLVSGIVNLADERLNVEIASIRHNNNLFPVKLELFDLDGLPGIYIPGAITRDVSKQSSEESLQLMQLASVDPSFKAQAATTGINTAKNLLSNKVKQVKVMVKAGYKVLLRDKNFKQ